MTPLLVPWLVLALLPGLVLPVPTGLEGRSAPDHRFGVAEGYRRPSVMGSLAAGWERVVLSWADMQPSGPDDFSWLGRTAPATQLLSDARAGIQVVGVLQFTPRWAQRDRANGERSVPRNLDLAYDDPNNYWGRFAYETARFYAGEVDTWIIWNEPEFRPGDAGAGGSFTWLGSDREFAQLMRVAYLAIKQANPNAVVSFPGTSYWVDQAAGRPQFYDRFLTALDGDPEAAAHASYHDAISLNLYRTPDDLVRVHSVFEEIQRRHGVARPIWLIELNAMPTDDRQIPCAEHQAAQPFKTTMDEQAAYAVQAFALGVGVGYERLGFYQMVDDDTCRQPAVWGITRDDGSQRPVADALHTTLSWLSGYTQAQFVPRVRTAQRWPAWPDDPTSFTPNWQVYQVAVDEPHGQRVSVVWNGDGAPLRVRVARRGVRARLVDRNGQRLPLRADADRWVLELPAATAHFATDPAGYHFIGGDPVLLIEQGVPPDAPVTPPEID